MSKSTKGDMLQPGDIVRVTVHAVPGVEHLIDLPHVGQNLVIEGKLGTLLEQRWGHWRVRVDGESVDHPGWYLDEDEFELVMKNPDYQEA